MVGYLETPNFGQALAEMSRRAVNEQWQHEVAPYFLSPNGNSRIDEGMVPIKKIFHLESEHPESIQACESRVLIK